MSSNADFISAQCRLLNLYENGHSMTQEQMVRALDGLLGVTQQMVRNRREEIRNLTAIEEIPTPGFRVITPPGSPLAQRRYPPAQLRPAAVALTFPNLFAAQAEERRYTAPVRPSQLLREINAALGLGRVAPVANQDPNHISWGQYFSQCIKYRSIGKARFESNCAESCAICLDTHINGDSVVTEECKHCFGKQCWQNWMCNPAGNQTCPTCRQHRPRVISFTMRRPRSNAIVDDNIIEITQEN
jgi:hypothetical protein